MQNHAVQARSRLCIFGCSPDTGNLGVSALFLSILNACATRDPHAEITVFDNGAGGGRRDSVTLGGRTIEFSRCGANMSKRYYRSDNLLNIQVSTALGGLGNPAVAAIRAADAMLDISGGDSFTDLYGWKRFRSMTVPKATALKLGTPLVFMPQTYGPFADQRARKVASDLVRGAAMAWARDHRNFETLRELVGPDFDPARHREGVDVAFALPSERPADLPAWLSELVEGPRARPVVGFNVSGLIYNPGEEGSRQFGFKADYQEIVHGILGRLLAETDASIVLIPHVLERPGSKEADTSACRAVAERLNDRERVHVVENRYSAVEMKWIIGQMDYFCGTRMHSTIAGLSSKVPTTAIAYSKKTQGVFESCGQGDHVADPRSDDARRCMEVIWNGWQSRRETAQSLRAHVPSVVSRAMQQNDAIFDAIDRFRFTRSRTNSGPATPGIPVTRSTAGTTR